MKHIRTWLHSYSPLSDPAWAALSNALVVRNLRKGEIFQRAGHRAGAIGFLGRGALYAKYAGPKRRHAVAFFNLPSVNRVVCDLVAFVDRGMATMDIIAVEPCELFVLERKQLYELYDEFPDIERLGRRLAEYSYAKAMERIGRMELKLDARMNDLRDRYPQVFDVMQDQLIADYLGIGKTHYSKLKRQLLKAA